jgi:DNA-binding transcriptional LysR family regulator
VRIEMPVLFGRHWVMPVVLELMDRYPALRFDVSLSNRVSNLLGEGVDVAVGIGRLTDSTDLVARALGTQKTVLCAAPSYLTRKGRPLSPDDLADHELIVERAGHSWSVRDAHGHVCEVPGCNRLHCHDMGAALDATFAGGGIARLPAWLAMPHIASGRLEVVLPKIDAGSLPIHIVWPRNRQLMARTRAVIDALLAYCVPVAPWAAVPGMTQSG